MTTNQLANLALEFAESRNMPDCTSFCAHLAKTYGQDERAIFNATRCNSCGMAPRRGPHRATCDDCFSGVANGYDIERANR